MEKLKYCKVRKVKTLNRANIGDAGIDFYVPEDLTKEVMIDKIHNVTRSDIEMHCNADGFVEEFVLRPHQCVLIPSGIHVRVPEGHALIFFNKSGVAAKRCLTVGSCVVDYPYQGECHIHLINTGECTQVIKAGEKIVQGIILPINFANTEEVNSLDELYKDFESTRGAGGFGSSGTN